MWWKKKSKEKEPKSYHFSTLEMCYVGDKYTYDVTANSREEAFEKLVKYFFEEGFANYEDIKSDHFNMSASSRDIFQVIGMPYWFGKRIHGQGGREELKKYAFKHGIKLSNS